MDTHANNNPLYQMDNFLMHLPMNRWIAMISERRELGTQLDWTESRALSRRIGVLSSTLFLLLHERSKNLNINLKLNNT